MFSVTDRKNRVSGFTLIEVLVAIVILTTVITVPITIIAQHLAVNAQSKQRVQAMLLAQEIIEEVRYTRDVDFVTNNIWFTHISSSSRDVNDYRGCVVDEADWLNDPFSVSFCRVLCFDGDNPDANPDVCGGTFNGFVSGVDTMRTFRGTGNPETCDGRMPKEGNALTATLSITVPSVSGRAWYASIRPCVSWADRNGKVHRVTLVETVFEWINK